MSADEHEFTFGFVMCHVLNEVVIQSGNKSVTETIQSVVTTQIKMLFNFPKTFGEIIPFVGFLLSPKIDSYLFNNFSK